MTRVQKFCAAFVLLMGGVFSLHPVQAQDGPPCGLRDDVVNQLADDYGEARVAMALDPRGIVEIWVNAATGSYTVTITTPEAVTCLLSAGAHWTAPAPLATGPAV